MNETNWYDDHRNLSELLDHLLTIDGLVADEAVYFLSKPWKWNAEWEELQLAILLAGWVTCETCKQYKGQMCPPHFGSARCESGSLASGGKNSHCTCSTCF